MISSHYYNIVYPLIIFDFIEIYLNVNKVHGTILMTTIIGSLDEPYN